MNLAPRKLVRAHELLIDLLSAVRAGTQPIFLLRHPPSPSMAHHTAPYTAP